MNIKFLKFEIFGMRDVPVGTATKQGAIRDGSLFKGIGIHEEQSVEVIITTRKKRSNILTESGRGGGWCSTK